MDSYFVFQTDLYSLSVFQTDVDSYFICQSALELFIVLQSDVDSYFNMSPSFRVGRYIVFPWVSVCLSVTLVSTL